MAVSRTFAPSIHIVRTKRHLRRDPVDHWVISYCARGAHLAKTADTELEVPARVPYLWSLGQEFLHERTHMERVQFLMRRDAFRDIAPLLDAACGSALDTPLGHLLGDYMMALQRHLPAVTEADFPRLSSAVGAMVVAAVAPSAERVAVARGQIDLGRKERVRQAVRRHLRTPDLGAEEPEPACRNVPLQSLSAVRRHWRRGPLHSAPAAARSAGGPVRPREHPVDLGDRRGPLLRGCLEFQPDFQTRVRP